MSEDEATLRSAVEAFNHREHREQYLSLYAPDVVLHGYPEGIVGFEGAAQFYRRLWIAFPDAHISLQQTLASGGTVAVRYVLSGLQVDDFYGAPVTGRATALDGIAMLRFTGNRVVEEWHATGNLQLLTRLAARAEQARPRTSASAEAAALRLQEREFDN